MQALKGQTYDERNLVHIVPNLFDLPINLVVSESNVDEWVLFKIHENLRGAHTSK